MTMPLTTKEDKRFVECSIEDYKGIIDLNKALSSSK